MKVMESKILLRYDALLIILSFTTCFQQLSTKHLYFGPGFSLVDTGMLKGYIRGAFLSFLVYRWVGFRSRPNAPNLQFWKIWLKKLPICWKLGVFLRQFGDGSQYRAFWGIEMVEILESTLCIPVKFFLKTPPPRRGVLALLHILPYKVNTQYAHL